MKRQRLPRKLQTLAVGVSLLATYGSMAILGSSIQASPRLSASDAMGNGTHLYGEAPQPDQIGKSYVLFQQEDQTVVGALYSPRSEFNCFTGSRAQNTLDIKTIGAYEPNIVELKIDLTQLHSIPSISKNDRRILADCQQAIAQVLGETLRNHSRSVPLPPNDTQTDESSCPSLKAIPSEPRNPSL